MADLKKLADALEECSPDELRRLRTVINEKLLPHQTPEDQEDLFEEWLEDAGLLTRPRPPKPDVVLPPFEPVEVEGEPLSETIIRERR